MIAERRTERPPRAGHPLKLLLVGYNGAGNLGADMRVAEIVRQMRAIFGADALDLSITTLGQPLPVRAFAGVRQELVDSYLPTFVRDRCDAVDGVVACEGSMFMSRFSHALALMMIGALGLASAQRKLSIGYGGEAGEMSAPLRAFVEAHCRDALVVCRNERSLALVEALGMRARWGADPAWTYAPRAPERADGVLRSLGWDGALPVVAVCPVNPFWWPVRADVRKAQELMQTGAHADLHYVSVFFHEHSADAERRYHVYLAGLAEGLRAYRAQRACFVVLVGMERLDRRACEELGELLGGQAPLLVSGEWGLDDVIAVLRRCDLVASPRFHAIVGSMPALVPAVGISTDRRIHELLAGLGREDLCIDAGAPDLAERVLGALRVAGAERDAIAAAEGAFVADQVRRLGEAGIAFADEVERCYGDWQGRAATARGWEAHLPPVTPALGRCWSAIHDDRRSAAARAVGRRLQLQRAVVPVDRRRAPGRRPAGRGPLPRRALGGARVAAPAHPGRPLRRPHG